MGDGEILSVKMKTGWIDGEDGQLAVNLKCTNGSPYIENDLRQRPNGHMKKKGNKN
ncbi:hypothetical protein YC2023_017656 [Brassica napus]